MVLIIISVLSVTSSVVWLKFLRRHPYRKVLILHGLFCSDEIMWLILSLIASCCSFLIFMIDTSRELDFNGFTFILLNILTVPRVFLICEINSFQWLLIAILLFRFVWKSCLLYNYCIKQRIETTMLLWTVLFIYAPIAVLVCTFWL